MVNNLAPPSLVEVITSDAVEPAMVAITEELDELENELAGLTAKADALEVQAEDVRRGANDSHHALSMLERVFAEKASKARAEMAAALAVANEAAERRIAAAHEEAAELVANPGAAAAFEAVDLPADEQETVRAVDALRQLSSATFAAPDAAPSTNGHGAHNGDAADGPTPAPRPPPAAAGLGDSAVSSGGWAAPPEPAVPYDLEREPAPAHNPTMYAPAPVPAVHEPSGAVMTAVAPPVGFAPGPGPDGFAQFWVPDEHAVAARASKPAIIDMILPMIAVAIVLMVVLSWVG